MGSSPTAAWNDDHKIFLCSIEFDTVGGVSHAEMLGRSNLLAIVGGGQAPKFPDRNGIVI